MTQDNDKNNHYNKWERPIQLIAGLVIWFIMMWTDIQADTDLLENADIKNTIPLLKYGFAIILIIGVKESVSLIKELVHVLTAWKSK